VLLELVGVVFGGGESETGSDDSLDAGNHETRRNAAVSMARRGEERTELASGEMRERVLT